ncbi:MAG: LysM peptidoglycan-binding domain-containing protein [Eubacteriales bacterium]|nr:LysM peptidoglycan-binding domain-containing protein [Eubacteriales bacterium]MDY3332951.1 LysM peptidoglycan-binding domain-containing protein [Gallibacter sp.]
MNTRYNRKKKTIIKSKFRFTLFIVVCMMLTVTFLNSQLDKSIAMGAEKDQFEIVKVTDGETLWSIAEQYSNEDTDIREMIYEIKKINDINNSTIKNGIELKIPKYL